MKEPSHILLPNLPNENHRTFFIRLTFAPPLYIQNIFGSSPKHVRYAALLKIPLLFEKKVKNEKFLADFLEKLLSFPGVFFGHPGTT